jgi:hypothetical protein
VYFGFAGKDCDFFESPRNISIPLLFEIAATRYPAQKKV